MTNLILLENSHAAALTYDIHIIAVVQFVGSQQKFIIGQLVGALRIITFEADLVQILLLQLVHLLEVGAVGALARSGVDLCRVRCLPLLDARTAEVALTVVTFISLYDNAVAEGAFQSLNKAAPSKQASSLIESSGIYALQEVEW